MDTKRIFELQMEINRLLEERPQYKPLQEEITNKLKNAGNTHNRLVLMHTLLMEKVAELHLALKEFNKIDPKILK